MRRLVETVVLALITVAAAGEWGGLICRVTSGSMAPAVLGTHLERNCPECGFPISVDASKAPMDGSKLWCPNCREASRVDELHQLPGDGLFVLRRACDPRSLCRGHVVAFRMPNRAGELAIKRLVGLPGETIRILDGDVLINDQLYRKTPNEQRDVAIVVYDDRYHLPQTSAPAAGWRPASSTSGWQRLASGWTHPARTSNDLAEPDWLIYRHDRPSYANDSKRDPAAVDDLLAYNQVYSIIGTYGVADLAVTCQVQIDDAGELWLRARDGAHEFRARLAADGHIAAWRGNEPLKSTDLPALAGRVHRLTMSLVDQQFLVEVDDRLGVDYSYDRGQASPVVEPFAIGAVGAHIELRDLLVWRDIYYRVPAELAAGPRTELAAAVHAPWKLGADEYFVLGDNSALSFDSRYQEFGPAVAASMIVGRGVVTWRYREMSLWGLRFQVPSFSQIRYIRRYGQR